MAARLSLLIYLALLAGAVLLIPAPAEYCYARAEELAPAGLITRKTTPEEAMQVLWSHGESLPERLINLLEGSVRRE